MIGRRVAGSVAALLVLAVAVAITAGAWLRENRQIAPLAFEQRCVATNAPGDQVVLTLTQAHWAAIVAGVGVREEVGVPGITIALATVYQESGIRNLDYGDRDSLGLFQQRPSQDWGTPEQIMDPWYASERFYAALREIPDWETGDVNDTAQAVQRSGHPQAYRKHEDKARILATVFAGRVPAGLSCFDERELPGDLEVFRADLMRTFGEVGVQSAGDRLEVSASSSEQAWALAAYAVANAGRTGIARIEAEGRSWTASQRALPVWEPAPQAPSERVIITFR